MSPDKEYLSCRDFFYTFVWFATLMFSIDYLMQKLHW